MRQSLLLDPGWFFHLGDPTPPLKNTHLAAYMAHKAGYARGPAHPTYDDSDWRTVNLPHDYSIEGPFAPDNHISNGYLPRGTAWYRRYFLLDESDRDKHLELLFDGISGYATVYFNGHLLHRHFSHYTPFTVDLSDTATFGPDAINTLAIKVDATHPEGWWYEGAGIYRHVHLIKSHKLHIPPHGIFVRPIKREGYWNTFAHISAQNSSDASQRFRLHTELLDPAGNVHSARDTSSTLPTRRALSVFHLHPIDDPSLWSCDTPNLYTLRTTLLLDDDVLEQRETPFGFRTLRFDPKDGFFLNDHPLKLKGTCNHQDHGPLGVALPDNLHEFRLRLLKEMGANAYRCAHHPPAPELLHAADRLGVLVLNENRTFGSDPETLAQLRAMIRRDRNHPCVFAWSLCNEEPIQTTEPALRIARTMYHEAKQLDPTRPITAAVSAGVLSQNLADPLDLIAINYQPQTYDPYHQLHPDKPLLAGETGCTYATRDTPTTDSVTHHFAETDMEHAPWGATVRDAWRAAKDCPHVAGLFVWSGFDYRGEPTPHTWPSVSSHWGLLDLAGFPKAPYYLHKAYFTHVARHPFIHLTHHWNHPGREGQPITLHAYTNADQVELTLNGQSLGRQTVDPIDMTTWTVPYRPGLLRATAYHNGRPVASMELRTPEEAPLLSLELHPLALPDPHTKTFLASPNHALPIIIRAHDPLDFPRPDANHQITLALNGPAKLLGLCNGDPTDHTLPTSNSISLFHGKAMAIIQPLSTPGQITLTASLPGLPCATVSILTHAIGTATVPPSVRRRYLTDWRMSPITDAPPDPTQELSDQDMNSWTRFHPDPAGQPAWTRSSGHALYRTTFTPPKFLQQQGGHVRFHQLHGSAAVFLDGRPIAQKTDPAPAPVVIPFPQSATPLTLTLLLRAATSPAGLTAPVEITS